MKKISVNRSSLKSRLFLLFFFSGLCSLLYQIVWTRLAMGLYGVTTPVLSSVVSVFMLGLSAGSWVGGRWIEPWARRSGRSAIVFYAIAEMIIGLGAILAPILLKFGASFLIELPTSNSIVYLLGSMGAIFISLFPWCFAMGTSIPFVLAFLKNTDEAETIRFSFLYTANVLGALTGVLVTVGLLVEMLGFFRTLLVAGLLNFLIAFLALAMPVPPRKRTAPLNPFIAPSSRKSPAIYAFLFMTGFTSVGLEIVWVRNFTPVLGTVVYAFASLLFMYLFATWAGAALYRRHLSMGQAVTVPFLAGVLAMGVLVPILINDPRLWVWAAGNRWFIAAAALASLVPFCATLGYITPLILDKYFHRDPASVGFAYAVNGAGCILGPLTAGFVLLPLMGAKGTWIVFGLPYAVVAVLLSGAWKPLWRGGLTGLLGLLMAATAVLSHSYELVAAQPGMRLERDHTATVICTGQGLEKRLWVNGFSLTTLTRLTKFMAHVPMAFRDPAPRKTLVLCFGMGTTFRSLLSWGAEATAVELVPSVAKAFPYFFEDAGRVLTNPHGRIVVDDGKRFLARTKEVFDLITIDPPPPIEAAGSSLLYSRDLYLLAKGRMGPGALLHQWLPYNPRIDEESILLAVAGSLTDVFPYVRAYRSIEGWGCHFIASMEPLDVASPSELARRMPLEAQEDFLEWTSGTSVIEEWRKFLSGEIPVQALIPADRSLRVTDDNPYNEYYFFRRLWSRLQWDAAEAKGVGDDRD